MSLPNEGYRLSPQQRHMWRLQQGGDGRGFEAHAEIRITGTVDTDRLTAALQQVIRRNEILRSVFVSVPGLCVPLQAVLESAEISWAEIDVCGLSGDEKQDKLTALTREMVRRCWDWHRGPLIAVQVARLAEQEYRLWIQLPALVADEVGLRNLVRAWRENYSGILENIAAERVQYAAVAEWLNNNLEDESSRLGRQFWRQQQQAGNQQVILPWRGNATGRKTAVAAASSGRVALALGELSREVSARAKAQGGSLAAWVDACWRVLLWRLTGETHAVTNLLCDGRRAAELAGVIGLLARNVPVTMEVSPNTTFADLFRRMEQAHAEARDWQEYFGSDDAEPQRPALMCLEEIEDPAKSNSDCESECAWRIVHAEAEVDRYQWKLTCCETQEDTQLELLFDATQWTEAEATRLGDGLVAVLNSAAENPETRLKDLKVTGASESRQLIEDFSGNPVDQSVCEPRLLHQCFEEQVARTSERTAVVFAEERLSYRDLNERANQLAHFLTEQGIGPDVIVGVFLERSVEMVVALLGVLKSGGAYLPLDPSYPTERLNYMIQDSNVPLLITTSNLLERVGYKGVQTVCLDQARDVIAGHASTNLRAAWDDTCLAYLLFTSGSTGRAKAVMISHKAIVNHMRWLVKEYPFALDDVVIQKTPFSFDASIWEFFAPLMTGAVLLIAPPGAHRDSVLLSKIIAEKKVTILQAVPTMLRSLLDAGSLAQCSSLRRIFAGGEQLSADLQDQILNALSVELVNLYGPTEVCIDAVQQRCRVGERVAIGRPIDNIQVYVLEDGFHLLPTGAAGELCLSGVGLGRGYLGRPAETAEKFVPNPFATRPGDRLYRTGDLARYRQDGVLECLSRMDHQVKIQGHRIELEEIEHSLRRHQQIRDAVAQVATNPETGESELVGYTVARETAPAIGELRAHLLKWLPEYMVPRRWVALTTLPMLPNGKIDRKSLPLPRLSRAGLAEEFVAPINSIEAALVEVWQEVLGRQAIGTLDNFFNLGGDSIRSLRVIALAKQRGLKIRIQDLFEHPSIVELAKAIEIQQVEPEELRSQPFSLVSSQDRQKIPDGIEDAYPLSRLQAGMLYHRELAPNSLTYHNVNSFHLRARLNPPLLQKAIQDAVDRHANLRTSFDLATYSEPLQLVHKSASVQCDYTDISYLQPAEQEHYLTEAALFESRSPFDISRPPLLRYRIIRRSAETFQFLMSEFHAISDGWSTTSLMTEIFERYFSLLSSRCYCAEPLPATTFRDYVRMEQEAVRCVDFRNFWTRLLKGLEPMRLPQGKSSWDHEPGRHAFKGVAYPLERLDGLTRLAGRTGAPLKTVCLAAYMKLLSLLYNREDVVTGLATNGRPEDRGGDLVRGLFINEVPFRLRVSPCSWLDLVKKTFELERAIMPYRRFPLSAIQEQWKQGRLLEAGFNFVHFHSLEKLVSSGDLEIQNSGNVDISDTSFLLNISFLIGLGSLTAHRLEMAVEYDPRMIDEGQVEAITHWCDRILFQMAESPLESHSNLDLQSLMPHEERETYEQTADVGELAAEFQF